MYKKINKKIVGIIEARMTSKRLPGKVLLPLAGKPALERLIERLKRSEYVDEIVVATTINKGDDLIVGLAEDLGVKYYRGSEDDVLKRVLEAAKSAGADIIVEITGDCPLVDWRLVDRGIGELFKKRLDYSANNIEVSYPDGFDVRVFPVSILEKVDRLTDDPIDRVHVTYYIYNHPKEFKIHNWKAEKENYWPDIRLTLDEKEDYELLNIIFEKLLPKNNDFSVNDVINLLKNNPKLLEINKYVKTKEPQKG